MYHVLEGLLGIPRQSGDVCVLVRRQLATQHCCSGVQLHQTGFDAQVLSFHS